MDRCWQPSMDDLQAVHRTSPVTFGMRLFAPSLYVLRDGTLVCLHGSYAPGFPGLRVIFSTDGGQTWIIPALICCLRQIIETPQTRRYKNEKATLKFNSKRPKKDGTRSVPATFYGLAIHARTSAASAASQMRTSPSNEPLAINLLPESLAFDW